VLFFLEVSLMIYQLKQGTLTVALSGTVATGQEILDGELSHIVVRVPALTGTGTITVRGTDSLGGTIYPLTTITEATVNSVAPIGTPTHFSGTLYFRVEETSGTQDAAADILYNLYYATKHG